MHTWIFAEDTKKMAQPTDEQIKDLVVQYTKQFDYILNSCIVYQTMRDRWYARTDKGSPAAQAAIDSLYNYATKAVIPAAQNWARFGDRLIAAGINVPVLRVGRLFDKTYIPEMQDFSKALHNAKIQNGQVSGTGIIPLIIIAIVLIVAAFTADDIVKQVDSSTAQQKSLVDATSKLCTEQNLSAADCKELVIKQQDTIATTEQNKPEGFLQSIEKLLFLGVAAMVIVPMISKSSTKNAA